MNQDAISALLAGLDAQSILSMFWFVLLFEGPRFVIANLAAGIAMMGRRATAASSEPLAVSVIVPCHNGAAGIAKTVASLREQTLRSVQIVIVDDGSVDDTFLVARDLKERGACDVVVSAGVRGGKSAALNLGLCFCTNSVVVCVDADTTFDRDGLMQIAMEFADPRVGAASGNIGVRNPRSSLLATMQAVEYTIGISLGRRVGMMLGILPIASGAFSAFRREAIESVGGWEAGPGEDADLTMKLRHAGWEIGFVPQARALTDVPTRLPDLISQRLRWESDLVRLYACKFQIMLWTRSRAFSLRNALSAIDVIVFSFGMAFVFLGYVVWLTAVYGEQAVPILAVSTLIYCVIGTMNFLVGAALGATPHHTRLLPYALGYGIYSMCVLQPIRLWACVDELLLGRSRRPGFVPTKVLKQLGSV